jgi:vanillate/3-O-methylgallate O-demethylase
VLQKLNGGPLPEVKFFTMDAINIKGRKVRCLRHGMAGAPGLEVWGPYAEADEIREAILEAGRDFGLVQVGARAYSSNTLESGWIPSPLPAIYTGGGMMQEYRDWLGADSYEAIGSLGGSLSPQHQLLPRPARARLRSVHQVRYHFMGEALKKIAQGRTAKRLPLPECEDLLEITFASLHRPAAGFDASTSPTATTPPSSFDRIVMGSNFDGFSIFGGYGYNERLALSLGVVDRRSRSGRPASWGEENGGTHKSTVEPHRQLEVRVQVATTPYARAARESYHQGWRTRQA